MAENSKSVSFYDKINNNYVLYVLSLVIMVFISLIVALDSYDTIRSGSVFFTSLLFYFACFLVLKKSLNIINVLFAFSLLIYGMATSIGFLGYWRESLQSLWLYSPVFLIIGPLGFFLSAKIILHGIDNWLTSEIVFIIIVDLFLSIMGVIIYDPSQESFINVIFPDSVVILLFILIFYEFYKIRSIAPEFKTKLDFLLGGIVITILGLAFNIGMILLVNDSTIVRQIVPTIGMIVLIGMFRILPGEKLISIVEKRDSNTKNIIQDINKATDNLSKSYMDGNDSISNQKLLAQPDINNEIKVEFLKDMIEELNGLSISILIESAVSYPKPINNKNLQAKFRKNKATITYQIKKLNQLGYLQEVVYLKDTRIKPWTISKKGTLFLYHLNQNLSKYLNSEYGISLAALGFI
ncbi:MAG: hypothetical protein ACW981_20910 [Candidatus Hodarchaeales archaeon]|jgi:hypothetical protein